MLGIYLALALAVTFPLVAHLDTHGPGHGVDDPSQTWSLWWFKYAIFNLGTSPLYSDYVFYPLGLNLVAYTPTFLNGLLSLPFQFAFEVIVAQNLVVVASLVLGGYGTFLFTRQVLAQVGVRSPREMLAAGIAGAVYAFGAWHINYVVAGHFMLLSNEWLPFFALYLVRLEQKPWRNGLLAGLFFMLAAWTELTFAPFLAVLTLLYLGFALVRRHIRRSVPNLAVLGAVAALGISPLALNLFLDTQRYGYYLTSGVGRIEFFSAEPISFFLPSAQHPVLGSWANGITNANTSYAFVGYAVLVLALLGLWSYRGAARARFWALAALFFALIMLGPALVLGGQATGVPLPFALLRLVPFVNANRYPVRFNAMLMLALAPLLALGVLAVLRLRRGALILAGMVMLLAFEQAVLPIPLADLRAPAVFDTIRSEPGDFAILDLPLGWRGSISLQGRTDDKAQFYQTVHQKRILGGITSRTPQFKFQYFNQLPLVNTLIALETGREVDAARVEQDRALAPEVLKFFNIRYVEVNRALAGPALLAYALDVLPLTEIYRDDTHLVYRVAALPPGPPAVNLEGETARLYFDDAWGGPQLTADGAGYRWATRADSHLWLPLSASDRGLTFRLYPVRDGQPVSVQVNGQAVARVTVTGAWQNYTVLFPPGLVRDGLNEIVFNSETAPLSAVRPEHYTVGDTGVTSPVDIAVTGAGYDAGRFGEITIAGQKTDLARRGYHLVAINSRTGAIDRTGSFDTFADKSESARLAEFVASLPQGEIVAGAAVDDVSRQLQSDAVDALGHLGVDADLRFQFRAGHAFIGVQGAQPGQAVQAVDGRFPANVAVGKNVPGDRIAFALGGIRIDR